MIAIVHSIYSQSVHAPARDAGLMDNDAERYYMYYARTPAHAIGLLGGTRSAYTIRY